MPSNVAFVIVVVAKSFILNFLITVLIFILAITAKKKLDKKIDSKKILKLTPDALQKNFIIADCCKPIPGDDVLGFIDEQNRVVIHKRQCPMAAKLKTSYGNRLLAVEWETGKALDFPVNIYIQGIDTIGILSAIYNYADMAYVGGGFGVGIHNTLEPATFGVPLAFGPNYTRFREACELIERGAARSISSAKEFEQWLSDMLTDQTLRTQSGNASRTYVAQNCGATDTIIRTIIKKIRNLYITLQTFKHLSCPVIRRKIGTYH